VEWDRHSTSSVFGAIPKGMPLNEPVEVLKRIDNGVSAMAEEAEKPVEPVKEGESAPAKVFRKVDVILETALSSAWLIAGIDRLTADNGKPPMLYTAYARVADPIVGFKDEQEYVEDMARANTFIELREKLNAHIETYSPELWALVNMKMTALVNRILNQNLGLNITIGSFVVDIQELVDSYLEEHYGAAVQDAFLRYQRSNIRACFKLMYEPVAKVLSEDLLNGREYPEEGSKPVFTYPASDYSLTFIDALSFELGIELSKDIGVVVTDHFTPELHNLVVQIFKEADQSGRDFFRHLIQTKDGRIMEATRGYIGENYYTLMLVK
jgi:hypothetical protein